jgi:hypothetical protein
MKIKDLKTPQEKLEQLENYYRLYSNNKGTDLKPELKNHNGFLGCLQWVFTPSEIIDINRFNVVNLNDYTWAVFINVEIIHYLEQAGIRLDNIKFYADCSWKAEWANQWLDQSNIIMLPTDKKELKRYIKMANKTVDFVLNNVPFGMFKEFKALAQTLAKEKALIISGSRDYHNGSAFENVETYKYLGACFPTAKITASLAIVNPNGVSQLSIIDGQGNVHTVASNPEVTPGDDIDVWIFATNVLNQNLPGYVNAEKGEIDRQGSTIDPTGIPVIYSAGKNSEDFTQNNRATTLQELVKDNTKFCWATVNQSQKDLIGGLGVHKVVVTHAANEPGHLGNPKYAGPDWGCGTNCWFIACKDEADARECIKYLTHPDVVKLVKGLKSSVTSNSKAVWKKIPHHSHATKWITNYA